MNGCETHKTLTQNTFNTNYQQDTQYDQSSKHAQLNVKMLFCHDIDNMLRPCV